MHVWVAEVTPCTCADPAELLRQLNASSVTQEGAMWQDADEEDGGDADWGVDDIDGEL